MCATPPAALVACAVATGRLSDGHRRAWMPVMPRRRESPFGQLRGIDLAVWGRVRSRSCPTSLLTIVIWLSGVALAGQAAPPRVVGARSFVAPGATIEGAATPGRTLSHFLDVRSGQYVHITIEPQNVPIVATLLDPSGTVVAEARDPDGGDAPLRLSVIVERSGVHVLKLVVPGKGPRPGRYRLTLDPPRAATEEDGLRVRAARAFADAGRLGAQETAESTREAMKRYEEARDIWHRVGDALEEAEARTGIGGLQFGQGSTKDALATVQDALSLYRTAGDRRGEATTLNNLGAATWSLGDARGALPYYERALPIARDLGLVRLEATIVSNIGSVHENLGEVRTALAFYERSLPLRRQAGDLGGEATSLSNMGVAYRMLGDRRRALSAYEEALSLARAADDTAAESRALQNLGALSVGVGDFERGEEALGRVLELSRRTGDRRGEGFALGWLGHAQRLKRNYAAAITLTDQELTLQRAINDRFGEGNALTYLGALQRLVLEPAAAEASLSAALRLHKEGGDRFAETQTLLELAGLRQDTGDLAAASAIYAQALEMSRALGDPGTEATALFHTAQLRRLQGDVDEARRDVEAAIALLESLRAHVEGARWRASYFVTAQDTYEFLIDLLMTMDGARPGQGLAQRALEVSERKRARSLVDLLRESGVESGVSAPIDATFTIDAHRLLDDRTVLLEFSLGARASYAWAISRGGMHAARLAPRAEITRAARTFHDLLAAPPSHEAAAAERRRHQCEAAGSELTRLLLEPLAEHLDRERLVIVADGALHYVPFAALPEPPSKRSDATTVAPPLVARYEVVFLPSVAALELLRENTPARKTTGLTVAVLADPVFEADDPRVRRNRRSPAAAGPTAARPDVDLLRAARDVHRGPAGSPFPRLPYSRQEADVIVSAGTPGSVLRALDFEASRSTALSSRLAAYDIVHFATHGFVDDARPDLSGLVLSLVDRAGRPQDGFLRLRDVHGLRLPVQLVVLSGCRTGLGVDVRGEGLLGIVRAFMHAGTPRVVASVWDVDDRATAVFMKTFYDEMLASGRSPAAALREAQLALRSRERWRDPFYWAAFVIQGEWN